MKINHNVTAQLANVSLKKNDRRIATSLERLSSGYKITKAADDAAGLAISNKMKAQIRALERSSRNAEDGTSIIETADGAMSEIEVIAQRIRELCVQASNDTYSLEDRAAIQLEVDEMLDEMDRIGETTEFNGKSLLNGEASRTVFSSVDEVKAISSSLSVEAGTYKISVTAEATPASVPLDITIPVTGKYEIGINDTTITLETTDTLASARQKIIDKCDKMNISVSGNGASLTLTTNAAGWNQRITTDYPDKAGVTSQGTDARITLGDGYEASASYVSDGNNIVISDNSGFEMQLELTAGSAGKDVELTVFDAGSMLLQIGANEHQTLNMDFPEISCQTLSLRDWKGVDKINVCTQFGATNAISSLDTAINKISAARSQLGSYQNRLESTISSLDVGVENMTDAMSRITDTDMAAEMTEYTQLSVMAQAATTMLSQANTRVETVMSLLQGM